MNTLLIAWCSVLTLALAAHMVKDGMEFRKIRELQQRLDNLEK